MTALDGGWFGARTITARARYRYRALRDLAITGPGLAAAGPATCMTPASSSGLVTTPGGIRTGAAGRGRRWSSSVHAGVVRRLRRRARAAAALSGRKAASRGDRADADRRISPSRRNWGYDGVLPTAPDTLSRHAPRCCALIDAAHQWPRALASASMSSAQPSLGPEGSCLHRVCCHAVLRPPMRSRRGARPSTSRNRRLKTLLHRRRAVPAARLPASTACASIAVHAIRPRL